MKTWHLCHTCTPLTPLMRLLELPGLRIFTLVMNLLLLLVKPRFLGIYLTTLLQSRSSFLTKLVAM